MSQLIAALQQAAAYPHPVGEIALRETHISWLLLTGEFVYKIKKPVRFDFLDFTTLEKRRRYCEEELRLNRQLSPELYLEVVPIAGTPDDPRVAGDGPAIEYAVKMRQFDERGLLSQLLASGELTSSHIDQLAVELARMHESAPRVAPSSPLGGPEEVRRAAVGNLDHISQGPDDDDVAQLRAWTESRFESLRETFESRRQAGQVRECHGDLHLGNIVLVDGRVRLFDRIEFNEEFRWIDVLSDAAFVAMDLHHGGRSDLAHRFLDKYLLRTGDYAGLKVLPWYLTYRALVRAKVAALRSRQSGIADEVRQEALRERQRYIDLARRFAQPRKPWLAITFGVSGTGKTTQTQPIVEAQGAVRLRSDVERKRMFGLAPEAAGGSAAGGGIYSPVASQDTYRRLRELAKTVVDAGFPAIVDATFLKRAQREAFRQLAGELGVPYFILPFRGDEATLRRRIRERARRGDDASEATEEILAQQLASVEEIDRDELANCRTVAELLALSPLTPDSRADTSARRV